MALSVPVQRDLAEYETKLIGKITKRTAIAVVIALSSALLMGFYINYVIQVSIDDFGVLILLATTPGWAIGYWMPDKMRPEKWLFLWFKHAATPDAIVYSRTFSELQMSQTHKPRKEERLVVKKEKSIVKQLARPGAEQLRPTEYF